MLIGIDYGGTKIEGLAMRTDGRELLRLRVPTPRVYGETLDAIADLVLKLETEMGERAPKVGVGIPGSISPQTGLGRNGNAVWLIGEPVEADLTAKLARPVRVANDGNCLALSEALEGAGRGHRTVFAVILGTGVGGGLVVDGKIVGGLNGVASEWGHIRLPLGPDDPGTPRRCFCGRMGCAETWLAGPWIERDHTEATGETLNLREISAKAQAGDAGARATLDRHLDRLGRGLGTIVNILDPDIFVLGGGVTNLPGLAEALPAAVRPHVLAGPGDRVDINVARAVHGDSSGVRGAARLFEQA